MKLKIVAKITTATSKKTGAMEAPPPTPNQISPPAQVSQDSTDFVKNPDKSGPDGWIGAVGSEKSNPMDDVMHQRQLAEMSGKTILIDKVISQLKTDGVSFSGALESKVKNLLRDGYIKVQRYKTASDRSVLCHVVLPMPYYDNLKTKLLSMTKTSARRKATPVIGSKKLK